MRLFMIVCVVAALFASIGVQSQIGAKTKQAMSAFGGPVAPGNSHRVGPTTAPRPVQPIIVRPAPRHIGMRVLGPAMFRKPLSPRRPQHDLLADKAAAVRSHAIRPHVISAASPAPSPTPLVVATTGLNPWWTFQASTLAGVGTYAINIGNGNLMTQATDMNVPNKGFDLKLIRSYNSMSRHDYLGTDGSTPSNYGNGWTNTFDAHLAYSSQLGILSVYDMDGTRFDYTPGQAGCWTPPAGQFASLCSDGANGYFWTFTSGIVYYFYSPVQTANNLGFSGRLFEIFGRNQNNHLTFAYSFDTQHTSYTNLNTIVVTAEDSRTATLRFADFGGCRLLSNVVWPDNSTTVSYGYDSSCNLTAVHEPGNNFAADLRQVYAYYSGGHQIEDIEPPSWVLSNGALGQYVYVGYNGAGEVSAISQTGLANPVISDGFTPSGPIQPSPVPTGIFTYHDRNFSYSNGVTTATDSDGRQSKYTTDSLGRLTQDQEWTGSIWLTASEQWDAQNNGIATIDARGSERDSAYDNRGNLIAFAGPAVDASVNGTVVNMRPTRLISYDSNNNIVALCDPVFTHQIGADWSTRPPPSDSLCPSTSGATILSWNVPSDQSEPYGQLQTVTSPLGYAWSVSYINSDQGNGDFGLPTSVSGTSYTENDGTINTPDREFRYDASGNVVCVNRGYNSTSPGNGWYAYQYESNGLGRLHAEADPDDDPAVSGVNVAACNKTAGLPGTYAATVSTYYPDGEIETNQTPKQHAANVSAQYTYDANWNLLTRTTFFGSSTPALTTNYYDGADRLVEVVLPHDPSDFYPYPWLTRFVFDLSQGGMVNIGNSTYGTAAYKAYGGQFKVQRFLSSPIQTGVLPSPAPTGSWTDISGAASDAMGRQTANYYFEPGGDLESSTTTYDVAPAQGLVASETNALGDQESISYDAAGKISSAQYALGGGSDSVETPTRTFTYDPDDRVVDIATTAYGTQTYSFDADGREVNESEPTGGTGTSNFPASGTLTSPANLTYVYYPDGLKSYVSVSSSALSQSKLIAYSYRTDGLPLDVKFTHAGSQVFSWAFSPGGRLLSRTDPFGSAETNTFGGSAALLTHTIPQGSYSAISEDPEGDMTGYVVPGHTVVQSYTVRGELHNRSGFTPYSSSIADGFNYWPDQTVQLCFQFHSIQICDNADQASKFDARSSSPLGSIATAAPTPSPFPTATSLVYTNVYDIAGRETEIGGGVGGFQYDAADRTVYSEGTQIAWGPSGHPVMTALGNNRQTLHFDGSDLLFSTDTSGRLTELNISSFGGWEPQDQNYTGLALLDRDMSGIAVSAHNNSGHWYWQDSIPYQFNSNYTAVITTKTTSAMPAINPWSACNVAGGNNNALMFYLRADGITDGCVTLQGGRAYSPSQATWTSMDSWDGGLAIPYTYLSNNPFGNEDPSGMCTPGGEGFLTVVCGRRPSGAEESQVLSALGCDINEPCVGPTPDRSESQQIRNARCGINGDYTVFTASVSANGISDSVDAEAYQNNYNGNVYVEVGPGDVGVNSGKLGKLSVGATVGGGYIKVNGVDVYGQPNAAELTDRFLTSDAVTYGAGAGLYVLYRDAGSAGTSIEWGVEIGASLTPDGSAGVGGFLPGGVRFKNIKLPTCK